MKKYGLGVFAGSFDPFTKGHLEVLNLALEHFAEVVILVMKNPNKEYMFCLRERINLIAEIVSEYEKVRVDTYDGYTVDYAARVGAKKLIRGIRSESDVHYESELAAANRSLNASIDTVLYWVDAKYENVSSTLVKRMYLDGQDISEYVPSEVIKALSKKLNH